MAPARVGGLERVVCTLTAAQAAAGLDVHVAAVLGPGEGPHPVVDELRAAGIRTTVIAPGPRAYWNERAAIASLCADARATVIHTHGYRPDVIDGSVARRLSIASVTTFHGFTGGNWRNRLYERAQTWVARRFDAVVAVSTPIAERLADSGVPRNRLHVIPNAHQTGRAFAGRAAARHALGIPADVFAVGWIGRLSSEKGPDVMLDAAVLLRGEGVSVSFIGEGPDAAALRQAATMGAVGSDVRWHGLIPDAGRYLQAFDAFVLSSRSEGTPMVLFEAMEAGVPIVATRVGGVPAVLRQGEALLIAPERPDAIAAALREIRAQPAAAARRAASARTRVAQDYQVAPWVERYADVYRAVTASCPSSDR